MPNALRNTPRAPQHMRTPQEALRSIRAQRELLAIEEAVQALEAETAGLTQRQIATELGRSQTDVHRLLRKSRAGLPSPTRRLILEAAAGQITTGMLVGRLKSKVQAGEAPETEQTDGYRPAELDEVRQAYMEGLLAEDIYNEICGFGLAVAP